MEWYELPTDREIDIQVLEIMGFPRKKLFYDDWDTDCRYLRYIPSGKPRRTHAIDAKPVPYFKTDIAAAWSLVERMNKTHHCLIKTPFMPGELYFCGFTPHGVTGWNGVPDIYEPGETMPLAICSAFLAVARAPQGEER